MADLNPDKSVIRYGKVSFIISIALVALTGIIYLLWGDKFEHRGGMFFLWLFLSALMLFATYQFYHREAYSPAGNVTPGTPYPSGAKQAWPFWVMLVLWLLYTGVLVGIGSSARADRVDNCNPEEPLRLEGNAGEGEAWIDFFEDCDNFDVKFDAPLKDYLRTHNRLPSWVMTKSGHTPDPVGWWNYYSRHKDNPYRLSDLTPDEKNDFYTGSRKLPDRILKQSE